MKHVNEIKFEGDTPWIKAFNEASDREGLSTNCVYRSESGNHC